VAAVEHQPIEKTPKERRHGQSARGNPRQGEEQAAKGGEQAKQYGSPTHRMGASASPLLRTRLPTLPCQTPGMINPGQVRSMMTATGMRSA
jgi:hypothetical protein